MHHLAWLLCLATPGTAQDEARAARLVAEERALDPARVSERVDTARRALAELMPDSTSEVARRVHLALGEALLDAGDANAARQRLDLGCKLARAEGATRSLAFGLLHLGIAADRVGEFEAAVAAGNESARLAVEIGNRLLEFSALNLVGATNQRRGEREAALVAWNRCAELAEAIGDASAICTVLNNLSVLLMNAGQLDRAEARLATAEEVANSADNREGLAAIRANQGDLELLRGRLAPARARHEEAVRIREALGLPTGLALARSRLAEVLLAAGEPHLAIDHLTPALAVQRERGLAPEVATTLARLARAYAAIDRPAEALRAAHEGIGMTQAIATKVQRVSVLQALADAHGADGAHALAFEAEREAFRLDEEVDSLELLASYAARDAAFQMQARERRIALLETERALQTSRLQSQELWRNLLLGGTAALAAIALLGWSLFLSRRRAHAALAHTHALEARVVEARRLESVALVAGGLAHDFNNLLTGILGNIELARLAPPGSAHAHDRLDDVEEASRRAAALAADMLTVSGRATLRHQQVDVNQLVERTVRLVRGTFPQRPFELDLTASLPTIRADPVQLGRVVHSLATNAAQALGEAPGVVTLRTRLAPLDAGAPVEAGATVDAGATVEAGATADAIEFDVVDSGPGMSDATRARLFEPFFSTKPGGRGLGLATAHGIVQRHGGTIVVDSAPGHGTTFTVRLPIGAAVAPGAEPVAPASRGAPTVLVIDDDESVRTTTAHLLAGVGCRVLLAADGAEGVACLEQHPDTIDVVILDLAMPGLSGEATLARLRALHAHLPVIVTTGYDRDGALDRLTGASQVLKKPFARKELQAALDAALGWSPGGSFRSASGGSAATN